MNAPGIDVAYRGQLGAFVLDAVFTAPSTGVTALFGPSGCGKTAVLRCIAGLNRQVSGHCVVAGEIWNSETVFLPPWRRPVGYVFQEASLFPHLSVRRNLLYGAPSIASAEAVSFDEAIELLAIGRLLDRSPKNLSGGERQRVAIGRALLSQPKLLLMDEPLSALDRATKDEILPFLERLHERLSIPIIYVSHDISEIERLADTIVLMQSGRVIAAGPLSAIQSDPALPLAAGRDAAVNLEAAVDGYDATYGLLTLRVKGGELLVPAPPSPPGTHRRLRIGAGDVSLLVEPQQRSSILNALEARILSHDVLGTGEILIVLGLGDDGARLLARITQRSWDHLELADGARVWAQVKGVSLAQQ